MEVTAERAFLRTMGGGCRTPFAAHASWSRSELSLDGAALEPDGGAIVRDRLVGPDEDAVALGEPPGAAAPEARRRPPGPGQVGMRGGSENA
jgi:porphobilinogen deaminase